jgi:hypothetical protein
MREHRNPETKRREKDRKSRERAQKNNNNKKVKAALLAGWERISLQQPKKKAERERERDGYLVWASI